MGLRMVPAGGRARGRWRRAAPPVLLVALLLPLLPTGGATDGGAPSPGDNFSYAFHQRVDNGGGEYDGYTDDTKSKGTYQILTTNQTDVVVDARYTWSYSNSEGQRQSGREERTVSFNPETRRYTSARTDLDEWDKSDARLFGVWFWIDPAVVPGQAVRILDEDYRVTARESTVWSNNGWVKGIRVEASGSSSRNDEYGQFSFRWTDVYHFDAASGYVIAGRYEEQDSGTFNGLAATFTLKENFDLTDSSYPIAVDYAAWAATIGGILGFVLLLGFLVHTIRWRTRTVGRMSAGYGNVKVHRLKRIGDFPQQAQVATTNFGPFLEDFARKGLLAKDRVAIARSPSGLVGVAVHNREADIGVVLCPDAPVTETLRHYLRMKDFFSEFRHTTPPDVIRDAAMYGEFIPAGEAYNVFETYQVLKLDTLPTTDYDSDLVRRMTPADLPAVEDLAKKVYGVKSPRWLASQLDSGDEGFVAHDGKTIVGFAFASFVHGHGRLHTLTVAPEHRNRGIGKELIRARLKALADLGARDAITEIADWNLPSIHIALAHGFVSVGKMFVETSRTQRIARAIVRR